MRNRSRYDARCRMDEALSGSLVDPSEAYLEEMEKILVRWLTDVHSKLSQIGIERSARELDNERIASGEAYRGPNGEAIPLLVDGLSDEEQDNLYNYVKQMRKSHKEGLITEKELKDRLGIYASV